MTIGCAIIAYNEEHIIEKTLKSVAFCDEIVVVDSGSSDNTLSIAKKYSKKVYYKDWEGYGKQKNFAISKLSTDWVLSIDADEIVTQELAYEIQSTIKETVQDAFLINIQLVFMGKLLKFGGTYPDYHLRLFKNGMRFEQNDVHEKIKQKGKKLKNKILHYSYDNLTDYMDKFNKYTSLIAAGHHFNGKRISVFFPFFRMSYEFFKRFFLQLAFLDGYRGSIYALLSSFYTFVKYAKLIELNKK